MTFCLLLHLQHLRVSTVIDRHILIREKIELEVLGVLDVLCFAKTCEIKGKTILQTEAIHTIQNQSIIALLF